MKARFTLYPNISSDDGMVLRSGKKLNCVVNTPMFNDIQKFVNRELNMKNLYHCPKCRMIMDLFDILEDYHVNFREGKIWMKFYEMCRIKLEEFIRDFDNVIFSCYCDDSNRHFSGALEKELEDLSLINEYGDYSGMANYTGYEERRLYRIYHKNFLKLEETLTYSYGGYEEYSDEITRDFDLMKAELEHWLKYFNQPHGSIVKTVTEALENHPKVAINRDCVSVILSFL